MFIEFIKAIIFGLVQGVTEFLPVSSSGHLVLLHKIFSLSAVNDLTFDVVLHFATFLAVFWYFRQDIWRLMKSWWLSLSGKNDEYSRLAWFVLIATIPGALAGHFWESQVENYFRSPLLVALMLVLVGLLFIIFEKFAAQTDNLDKLDWKKSLLIGCSQAIALIPGTSRSGITIISGLALKLKRGAAVRFSFLLSIPIIFGATITKAPDLIRADLHLNDYGLLILAFLSAFIAGLIAIKFFIKFAQNHKLNIFAYYRFLLAAIIVLLHLLF